MSVVSQPPDRQGGLYRDWLSNMRAKWLADIPPKAEKGDAQSQFALATALDLGLLVPQDHAAAAQWYRKAADQDHPEAQCWLGVCYAYGYGMAMEDEAEAAKWYWKAAEQNNSDAQFALALCHENGQGVPKDAKEAVHWYRKAADQNHAIAQYKLGVCYDTGQGVVEDEAEAVKWFRKSAQQDDVDAQYNLGICYEAGQGVAADEVEAAEWYRKAAEQGHPQAQYNLGVCYDNGRGVAKDEVEAVKWYQKAAEQGHPDARFAEAVRWYRKAAEQGHAQAQYNLGRSYDNGEGVAKDEVEAVKWYRKAAEQNHADAQYALAARYDAGQGTTKDEAEAAHWYRKAAEQGHTQAQFRLAWCYDNGEGVAKDEAEAANWYRKAADQGHAQAQFNLAWNYDNGEGVAKDEVEAAKWYRRAAEQNHAEAQYALGVCYDNGQGVPKDEVEAADWYRKAAEQNHAEAQSTLRGRSAPSPPPELPHLTELMTRLNSLVGLAKVKEDVCRIISLVKVRRIRQQRGMKATPMSLHLVFTGNPGTGKTTVARLLGEIYHEIGVLSKGHLTETDRSGLVAGFVGQTAIKVSEVVQGALGGILFIDEAYSLAQQEGASWDFGREAIDTLLKRMEDHRDDLVVIVAGYTEPMKVFLQSNPGLQSRFNKFLHFDDYSPQELFQIFEKYCQDEGYTFGEASGGKIKALINLAHERRAANFGNARATRNLFEQIISNHANRIASMPNPSHTDLTTIVPQDVHPTENM